jgi:phosphate transport system substrate-binding protein
MVPAATAAAPERVISYVGSSTIGEHLLPAVAPAFTARTGIRLGTVDTSGSGAGMAAVLRGDPRLAGVARALTRQEKQAPLYYQIVGYDAIVVFVHASNPVTSLTKAQLKGIYTGRIRSWKEVGGRDAPIVCITEIEGRGQMIEFRQHVLDGAPYRHDRREVDRQEDQVAALRAEPNGIASISRVKATSGIRAVALDGFPPERAHVRSGAYVLSRPLILLSKAPPTPEVKRLFAFFMTAEAQAIVDREFVSVR